MVSFEFGIAIAIKKDVSSSCLYLILFTHVTLLTLLIVAVCRKCVTYRSCISVLPGGGSVAQQ